MFIDLHTHEELFSPCSYMSLEKAVETARALGLNGICITDHNSMRIAVIAEKFLQECAFPVFIGVEMTTHEGDIVAFGLESLPQETPMAQEFVDFVNAQNGFCFAAHPYSRYRPSLGDGLFSLRGLHGVEVANGGNMKEDDEKAFRACKRLGLTPVGGSDAHAPEEIGRYATWLPKSVTTVHDLVTTLKTGKCCAVSRDIGGTFSPL
ncbi:MAG: hypothetical protein DELT_00306 [Desulfovibrio sp.]